MKVLVGYHQAHRTSNHSYYYYRNHPSYRQLASTLGSGFKSRICSFFALLMQSRGANERWQALEYHRNSIEEAEEGEPSERKSPKRRTKMASDENRSFKSYCKRPKKANG